MQITVREAGELLKLSESEIYSLVRKKKIPAHQVNKSYLFNRVELLEWAIANNVSVSPKLLEETGVLHLPTIVESLKTGGINYGLSGNNRQEVLREIVDRIPKSVSPEFNADALFSALIARETLGSTAIGNGIAIPHVRNPIVLDVEKPLIVLCFLKTPIDFGAIDNKPVHTFFTLISTTVRVHLHLLAHLSYLLHSPEIQQTLQKQAAPEEILGAMGAFEATLDKCGAEKMSGQQS